MAIQNTIHLPDRMSKKKYFYDPILEKAILNNATALSKDSSMDYEDYKDVCFCPSNNKLYAVRVNSATSAGAVDVICPNTTTESQTPQASITVGDNASVILYCPTVRRIFAIAPNKYYIINPRDNTVDAEINHGQASVPSCAVYNPMLNKIHVGFTDHSKLVSIAPGNINHIAKNIGVPSPVLDLDNEGISQITGICINPELNYLYLFDGSQAKGSSTGGVFSSAINIDVSKDPVGVQSVSYQYYLNSPDWLAHGQSIRDSIYCPFNGAEYWLSSPDGDTDGETRVHAMGGYTYPMSEAPSLLKTINISPAAGGGNYNKLVYCPDNNMIYAIGDTRVQVINPADKNGITPVADFHDNNITVSVPSTAEALILRDDTGVQTAGLPVGVWGDGNFIYSADGNDGLRSYSVDGSGNLSPIDLQDEGDYAYDVWGDGNFIYVGTTDAPGVLGGLHVYSVDSSGYLAHIGSNQAGGTSSIRVWGDGTFIYSANHDNGLCSYSVDGSGNLALIGCDYQGDHIWDVWGDGTFIYSASVQSSTDLSTQNGLHSYSVDGSGNLSHIASHYTNAQARGVWGDGNFIYLANMTDGLRSYSVDGSGNLSPIDTIPASQAAKVWGDGTYIYVANGGSGLHTYEVNTQGYLAHVGGTEGFPIHTSALDVWGDGSFIYVAGFQGGLHSYQWGSAPSSETADFPNNGVCYSPVNNRIYGVGDSGLVAYIDPTS